MFDAGLPTTEVETAQYQAFLCLTLCDIRYENYMKALITRKVGMTSTINQDGVVQAITLLSVADHTVISHKTDEKDGYTAVQLGTETAKKLSKSVTGHVKTAKVLSLIHISEPTRPY